MTASLDNVITHFDVENAISKTENYWGPIKMSHFNLIVCPALRLPVKIDKALSDLFHVTSLL